MLTACNMGRDGVSGPYSESVECVPIPEGNYAFKDGQFSPLIEISSEGRSIEDAIFALEETFERLGYAWLSVEVSSEAIYLKGVAPDQATKERGFSAGAALVRVDEVINAQSRVLVDKIILEGELPLESALVEDEGPSADFLMCQSDLAQVLDIYSVRFVSDGASLTGQGERTLDQVKAILEACPDYSVQISVRPQGKASQLSSVLPTVRAESVRRYLEQGGINSGRLAVMTAEEWTSQQASADEAERQDRPVEIGFTLE